MHIKKSDILFKKSIDNHCPAAGFFRLHFPLFGRFLPVRPGCSPVTSTRNRSRSDYSSAASTKDRAGSLVEDQDLVVDGFGLHGCILCSPPQAQAAGCQAHGVEDPPRQPRLHAGLSGEGGNTSASMALKVHNGEPNYLFFMHRLVQIDERKPGEASPVRPRGQRRVGDGGGGPADLKRHCGIQVQSRGSAPQSGSLSRLHGDRQAQHQHQHQQSSRHLKPERRKKHQCQNTQRDTRLMLKHSHKISFTSLFLWLWVTSRPRRRWRALTGGMVLLLLSPVLSLWVFIRRRAVRRCVLAWSAVRFPLWLSPIFERCRSGDTSSVFVRPLLFTPWALFLPPWSSLLSYLFSHLYLVWL